VKSARPIVLLQRHNPTSERHSNGDILLELNGAILRKRNIEGLKLTDFAWN
jgi:hypothetical protein